ncbi:MAG TPA: hypothetical protein VMS55_18055 [Myxococcota bacterium]|nr:hypothetical protein [Myxococcota bacterium]
MEAAGGREEREKSLERQIRAFHWVRLLSELPARCAGGEGEREAAARVEAWMRELGFAEVAPGLVASRPERGAAVALHAGLAALACAVGGFPGFAVAALSALSYRRECKQSAPLLSRWLPAPDAEQVRARAGSTRPRRRIVLSAPLDAPRAGRLFGSPWRRRWLGPAAATRVAAPAGLDAWLLRLLAAAAIVTAASALGGDSAVLWLARVALSLLAAGVALAGLDWARAPACPGAGSSASGVAALLTCAEQLLAQLRDDEELWLVATGAQETGAGGLADFVDSLAGSPARDTLVVHFERLGGDALARIAAEVGLERCLHPPRLAELARRLAESCAFGSIGAVDWIGATGVAALAARGMPVLALVSTDPDGLPRNDHQPIDPPESVDAACVVRAADFAAAVVEASRRGEGDALAIV